MRELDGHYTMKQMALNAYSQKGQETIDKIYQVCTSTCIIVYNFVVLYNFDGLPLYLI